MTVLAAPTRTARAEQAVSWRRALGSVWIAGGVGLFASATAVGLLRPGFLVPVVGALAAVVLSVLAVRLVVRRPATGVGGAVVLFALSGELQLRLGAFVGLTKDAVIAVLVTAAVIRLVRGRGNVRSLGTLAPAAFFLAVLAALYVLDPAGENSFTWIFGARLLLSVLVLAAVGVLLADRRSLSVLVAVFAVLTPFEAGLAWVQRMLGWEELVYTWGYEFGAQVRLATDGGLRTSGTFQDPFQLAALAALALTVGLFLTSGRVRLLICVSAVAVLLAADVRTAMLQSGIVLLLWAFSRGLWRQSLVLAVVAATGAALVLGTTTSQMVPGGPERPLLLTLNGRFVAWSNAIESTDSIVIGNGVGAKGTGSTRTDALPAAAPSYDEENEPDAVFAGNDAFLDSAYAQVISDVGVVGLLALLAGMVATVVSLLGRARVRMIGAWPPPRSRDVATSSSAWAALAVLALSAVDWIGRASLASFSTGYLAMLVLGVLVGAALRSGGSR